MTDALVAAPAPEEEPGREFSPEIVALGDAIWAMRGEKAGQLAQYLEEVHGIEAATLIVQQPRDEEKPPEKPPEKTEWAVVITGYNPEKKITVIKEARTITGLGLKETKELSEKLPATVREGLPKADAEKIKATLEAAGAKVELR
jgi:large subunit ribosomal protein L7/L12